MNNGDEPSRGKRLLKQGAVALTALGVIGWIWQTKGARESRTNLHEP